MSIPSSAQQIADFVQQWNDFGTAINNGASWCFKCIDMSDALISNPNFTTILSADQQQWVINANTYFKSLPASMPPTPPS